MQFIGCCSRLPWYLYVGVRVVGRQAWLVVSRMFARIMLCGG